VDNLPIAVLHHLPDPVVLIDANRSIVAANRAANDMFESLRVGQDLALSIRHPDILAAVDAAMRGDPPRDLQATLPGSPPRNIAVHTESIDPKEIKNKDHENVAAVIILADVTAAKRSERMRVDFVANASHELRSPLSAIMGFLETLAGSAKDDPEARERFVEIMLRESRRMTRLIDDLLSLSRVEINEHVRPTGSVDIGRVIRHVTEALGVKASDRDIEIETGVADDLPAVIGDEEQVMQVVHNLIDNAIKYSSAGTSIKIAVEPISRVPGRTVPGVAVSVADQGIGIPTEIVPRLTERFFRVDAARSRELGSTGLGLAICKHIINRHRGHLAIDSVEGEGSTFTVSLPIKNGSTATTSSAS